MISTCAPWYAWRMAQDYTDVCSFVLLFSVHKRTGFRSGSRRARRSSLMKMGVARVARSLRLKLWYSSSCLRISILRRLVFEHHSLCGGHAQTRHVVAGAAAVCTLPLMASCVGPVLPEGFGTKHHEVVLTVSQVCPNAHVFCNLDLFFRISSSW